MYICTQVVDYVPNLHVLEAFKGLSRQISWYIYIYIYIYVYIQKYKKIRMIAGPHQNVQSHARNYSFWLPVIPEKSWISSSCPPPNHHEHMSSMYERISRNSIVFFKKMCKAYIEKIYKCV